MPGTLDAVLWSVAAMLGASALWMSRPRPPAYDPARVWGMTLSTIVRGRLEREGKDVPDWEKAVAETVPTGIPGDWYADPATLGPDHDPAVRIGPAASWDAIAEATPAAWSAVDRALEGVVFVRIGDAPALDLPTEHLPAPDDAVVARLCAAAHTRLVLLIGADATPTLRWLVANPAVRDRVRALFFFGAVLDSTWAEAELGHTHFDTELHRQTPWLWLQVRGPEGESPALRTPPEPPTGRRTIEVVPLGVLGAGVWAPEVHGRALRLLVAAMG